MAKKQNNNAINANNASIQRSKAYANQVKKMFDDCVDDILAVQKTIPTLTEGQMFSFDACPMNVQKQVEELLRRLSSTVTLATQAGIKLEWDKANASADSLLKSVAGKAVLRDPHFSAYTQRNHEAMYNFMNRKEGIMTLSDRIWQTTKQLREEMEVALTVGIGEGKSAKEMTKDVKQYLNEPDLMFKRFRYKKGEKITDILDENGNKIGENKEIIWGKKWKKLEIDANGKKHFIDYDKDSYKTGAGYYKSAHKNAMRVTRTETNMAYKRSDQQRWQQFDFILGYHVEPCANHTEEDCEPDICEMLKGDYPKDFTFEGWHPQCKCVCTPIMMDDDEMLEMFDAQAEGKPYTPKSRQITDYPDNFKTWCQCNADKIEKSHKIGKDPYFIRHNWETTKAIADDKWEAPEPEAKIEPPVMKEKEPKQEEKQVMTAIEKLTVQELPEPREDSTKLSLEERADILLDKYKTAFGKNDYRVDTLEEAFGKNNSQLWRNAVFKQMKKYETIDTKALFESASHLNILRTADLSSIPEMWRKQYNEYIGIINAHNPDKGTKNIYQEIEGAYNIYKLITEKKCLEYGLDKLSCKTPYNIFTEVAKKLPNVLDNMPSKEFFDKMSKFIPLTTKGSAKTGAYFSPTYKHVMISMKDQDNITRMAEKWYSNGLFYHEYGHAYDDLMDLRTNIKFETVFKKYADLYNSDNGIGMKEKIAEYMKKQGGYSALTTDQKDRLGALTDTLQAMLKGHVFIKPMGHSEQYFSHHTMQMAEFIAHCSENYWAGNDIFKELAPDLYDEMSKLMQDIFK